MSITATKIGKRSALWRALGQEMQRRHRLGLPFPDFDHNALAKQIAMASHQEDLWTYEPAKLANSILNQPYKIPVNDEIFELELSITYRELAPDWDAEIDFLLEAIARQPMVTRFQGKGIQL